MLWLDRTVPELGFLGLVARALDLSFHCLAERELMLPRSLTKRRVNHAGPSDVTKGYAADWTVEQLREPVQRVADRVDELMGLGVPGSGPDSARGA